MVAHPPMLYMGYVGFSVAFAFSVAALISGRLDADWARWMRPWTTAAWVCLTIGIMLGSLWAYYELGWGGWWFWDPVENASFMPWLAGTALIHSLAVSEKRGSFKSWTVLLAITSFSLSLLGTFLVRSGVLSSVHAFATDPRRGLFILVFLAVVVGASLTLYAWRAPKVGLGQRFAVLSKESSLLANNVLLMVAMASVLLGTLYPLFLDALGLGKISVGPPYFDTVFVPLMAPLVFLMGVGPVARWKEASLPDLWARLRWALLVSVVAALATGWLAGRISFMTTVGLWMAFWILASVLMDLWDKIKPSHGPVAAGLLLGLRRVPRSLWAMWVAHLGVAAFAMGVSMVNTYQKEQDVQMNVGDTTEVNGYVFTLRGVRDVQGPNYVAARGDMQVTRGGREVAVLSPEKRVYRVQSNPMTEAAIDAGITRDLYVSMGEQLDSGAWIVRVYVKPFVDWIWGGCVVMALGGVLAVTDRRYRARKPVASAAGGEVVA
jgi:cytochrome c-type biogenesis protein CcmF